MSFSPYGKRSTVPGIVLLVAKCVQDKWNAANLGSHNSRSDSQSDAKSDVRSVYYLFVGCLYVSRMM